MKGLILSTGDRMASWLYQPQDFDGTNEGHSTEALLSKVPAEREASRRRKASRDPS